MGRMGPEELDRLRLWARVALGEVRDAGSSRLADLVSRVVEEIEFDSARSVPDTASGSLVPLRPVRTSRENGDGRSRRKEALAAGLWSFAERSPFAVRILGRDGTTLFANERWGEVWGRPAETARGENVRNDPTLQRAGLIPYVERALAGFAAETSLLFESEGVDGASPPTGARWLRVFTYPATDPSGDGAGGAAIVVEDVTARKLREDELARRAFYDELTGLANRSLLTERLSEALSRDREKIGTIFLDLDDFKRINDSLGHAAGNALLARVARRLVGCVRARDTVARLGGDEFVVLLEGLSGLNEATETARRLLRELRAPFLVRGRLLYVTCSVGVVVRAATDREPEALLALADEAMYRAKLEGKDRLSVSAPDRLPTPLPDLPLDLDGFRA